MGNTHRPPGSTLCVPLLRDLVLDKRGEFFTLVSSPESGWMKPVLAQKRFFWCRLWLAS